MSRTRKIPVAAPSRRTAPPLAAYRTEEVLRSFRQVLQLRAVDAATLPIDRSVVRSYEALAKAVADEQERQRRQPAVADTERRVHGVRAVVFAKAAHAARLASDCAVSFEVVAERLAAEHKVHGTDVDAFSTIRQLVASLQRALNVPDEVAYAMMTATTEKDFLELLDQRGAAAMGFSVKAKECMKKARPDAAARAASMTAAQVARDTMIQTASAPLAAEVARRLASTSSDVDVATMDPATALRAIEAFEVEAREAFANAALMMQRAARLREALAIRGSRSPAVTPP